MTTPTGVYPLAAPSGESIPFDVLKPVSLASQTVSTTASTSVVLPTGTDIVVLISTVDAVARLGSDIPVPVAGTFYSDAIFLPAGIAVSVLLSPGTLYMRSIVDPGTVYVQLAEKWNALAIGLQYGVR